MHLLLEGRGVSGPLEMGLREVVRDELYRVLPELLTAALQRSESLTIYTEKELGDLWGVHRSTITRLVNSGELPAIDGPSRGRVIRASDAAAYLDRQARKAARTGPRAVA